MSDPAIFEMPPIPRESFESDEAHARAVETSTAPQSLDAGSNIFIPEPLIVDTLLALHANHHATGMGVLHDGELTREEAEEILKPIMSMEQRVIYIDYLKGRPVKIKPLEHVEGGYTFVSDLYNRNNPELTAEEVVARVIGDV